MYRVAGPKKNGDTLSYCKYFDIYTTELHDSW